MTLWSALANLKYAISFFFSKILLNRFKRDDCFPLMVNIATECILSFVYTQYFLYYRTQTQRECQRSAEGLVTDTALTERQNFRDDHLSKSLRFFSLPLENLQWRQDPMTNESNIKRSSEPVCTCLYQGLNPSPLCS